MMNSYRRTSATFGRRPTEAGRLAAITVVALAVILVDLASGGLLRATVQRTTGTASAMISRAFNATGLGAVLQTRAALIEKNQALEDQLARYADQEAAYKVLQDANAHLSEMAHLAQDNAGITAPVVSSYHSSPYGTFLIGAGAAEGVAVDTLVLTEDGFVIGRVSEAGAHTALVTQILAPGNKIDAMVADSEAEFTGTGGSNARAQIPRGVSVEAGALVTSGSVGARPIGVVGKVESEPSDAYSTVYMRLPQNTALLRYVFVLTN